VTTAPARFLRQEVTQKDTDIRQYCLDLENRFRGLIYRKALFNRSMYEICNLDFTTNTVEIYLDQTRPVFDMLYESYFKHFHFKTKNCQQK
jgi:hypothetical protein